MKCKNFQEIVIQHSTDFSHLVKYIFMYVALNSIEKIDIKS